MLAKLRSGRLMADLPPVAADTLVAMRLLIVLKQRGRDPMAAVIKRLGSPAAVCRFLDLVHACGEAWPDSFAVNPPCATQLSPDEMLFADMVDAALAGCADRFERATDSFFPRPAREKLWAACIHFVFARAAATC